MSQQKAIARAILDADGWITTADAADQAQLTDKIAAVQAYVCNLRTRGLIESRKKEGTNTSEHRVADRALMLGFIDGDKAEVERARRRAVEAEATRRFNGATAKGLGAAIAEAGQGQKLTDWPAEEPTPAPAKPNTASPDKPPARAPLTYAIDQRGKLVLCFGDSAYELQPPQWAPLAKFLGGLAGVFA